ncbi:MAG: hypothetical protein ACI9M1_000523 [Porticoccaceae bacterium]|jgi:uncharacterized protein (DUF2461 family)
MKTVVINNSTLKFLSDISENNNRDWFQTNKHFYLEAQENMYSFIDNLILELNKHDQLEIRSAKKTFTEFIATLGSAKTSCRIEQNLIWV